jgi:hypothetical protein
MKTECKSIIHAACYSFGGVICAGVVLLIAANEQAQNLFEVDMGLLAVSATVLFIRRRFKLAT